jgi:hypothetical protein
MEGLDPLNATVEYPNAVSMKITLEEFSIAMTYTKVSSVSIKSELKAYLNSLGGTYDATKIGL